MHLANISLARCRMHDVLRITYRLQDRVVSTDILLSDDDRYYMHFPSVYCYSRKSGLQIRAGPTKCMYCLCTPAVYTQKFVCKI